MPSLRICFYLEKAEQILLWPSSLDPELKCLLPLKSVMEVTGGNVQIPFYLYNWCIVKSYRIQVRYKGNEKVSWLKVFFITHFIEIKL